MCGCVRGFISMCSVCSVAGCVYRCVWVFGHVFVYVCVVCKCVRVCLWISVCVLSVSMRMFISVCFIDSMCGCRCVGVYFDMCVYGEGYAVSIQGSTGNMRVGDLNN